MADVTLSTLYEMNQQLMSRLPSLDIKQLESNLSNVGAGFSLNFNNKYYMLLCKELSDYTVIHINNFNGSQATEELKEILESRGEVIGIDYIHGEDGYQCGVRKDGISNMYYLFPYDGGIVEVG